MIDYNKALKIIFKNKIKINNEKVLTSMSLNRICAKNIYSPANYPPANNSAFDGFALVFKETKNLNEHREKRFKIIKTVAAGDDPKILNYKKGSTIEIMTGGVIPKPFDTVVPVEDVKVENITYKNKNIIIKKNIKKHAHVRFAGSDFNKKDLVVKNGEIIEPKHLMAFSILGIKKILVKKQPKILFISTGKEIVKISKKKIKIWQIRNSNNNYLISLNKYIQSKIIDGGIIKDNQQNKLKKLLRKITKSNIDIVLTSGAISAGKFDFIPKILKQIGIKILFKKVAIRPGKPILFGRFPNKNKFFFGLPGNPISSAACFRFFVYPFLRHSLELKKEKLFKARLKHNFIKKKKFTRFLKGILSINNKGAKHITILKGQESFRIKPFVKANVWSVFRPGKEKFRKGELVDCLLINP